MGVDPFRQPRAVLGNASGQLRLGLFREGQRIVDLLLRGRRRFGQRQLRLSGRPSGVKEIGKRSLIRHGILPVLVLTTI